VTPPPAMRSRRQRVEALLYRVSAGGSGVESAVRAWATADAHARAAVEAVDVERIRYLRNLMVEAGVPAPSPRLAPA